MLQVSVERGVSRVALSINLTVTEHPRSQTALLGESAIFWCKGHGPSILNIANTIVGAGEVEYFAGRGITWQYTSSDCSDISQWRVTILASDMNNGTMLKCFFHDNDCPGGETHTAKLIIVTGKLSQALLTLVITTIATPGPPGPPVAPSVTVTNLTALTLTWTAPWPFPVINYTVTMLNLTSNQITQWTATEERYVLTNEQESGQCDELVFTVEAETDVGSTGSSTNTTSGFPNRAKNNF